MNAAPDFVHSAEMGFSHRELLRALPTAVAPFEIEKCDPLNYLLRANGQQIRLTLHPESTRKIAALSLPLTQIRLEFFGFQQSEFAKFMHKYQQSLQRGGG